MSIHKKEVWQYFKLIRQCLEDGVATVGLTNWVMLFKCRKDAEGTPNHVYEKYLKKVGCLFWKKEKMLKVPSWERRIRFSLCYSRGQKKDQLVDWQISAQI